MTNRELIGDIINQVKEMNADSRLSKRKVWFSLYRAGKKLIDRDLQVRKLWRQSNLWKSLCVEMEEINSIQCTCVDIESDCTIMRSKNKLPKVFSSILGPAIYSISTIDNSKVIVLTSPRSAVNNSSIKGVSDVYGFVEDDYLYILKNKYQALLIRALFEEDTTKFACDYCPEKEDSCHKWLDEASFIPERLEDDTVKIVLQELMQYKQIILDTLNNNNSNVEK